MDLPPVSDDGDLRGVSIYDSRDDAEVRIWVEADPAIRSGRLTCEVRARFGISRPTLTES